MSEYIFVYSNIISIVCKRTISYCSYVEISVLVILCHLKKSFNKFFSLAFLEK